MSLPKATPLPYDLGIVYDFDKIGDTLPMHEHDETTNHITIVAWGSFLLFGAGWERVVNAGPCETVIDWQVHDPHGARALEDNSRMINVKERDMGVSTLQFQNNSGGNLQFQNNSGGDIDFISTGATTFPVVRLGDASNHGGTMTTATGTPLEADGITVCKNGDHHTCPITGHGTTPVTDTAAILQAGGDHALRQGDMAGCGAIIIQGSPTLSSE